MKGLICAKCGLPTNGVELTPGTRSAMCPECNEARVAGKFPVAKVASKPGKPGKKGGVE